MMWVDNLCPPVSNDDLYASSSITSSLYGHVGYFGVHRRITCHHICKI